MATARPRAASGLTGGAEEGTVYGKRDNIAVPDADEADAQLTAIETAAAARETDRFTNSSKLSTQSKPYAPDAVDYTARGSERSVN